MDPDLRPQLPGNNLNQNPQNIYDMQPPVHTPMHPPEKKRFGAKKWLVVSGISLLVVGALTAVWALYYNSPGRVLADVFNQSATSKTAGYTGTVTTVGKGDLQFESTSDISGEINENALTANTQNKVTLGALDVSLDLDLLVTEESVAYLKLTNAAELGTLVQSVMGGNPYADAYTPLFEQLESTWIKLDGSSEESFGSISSTCDTKKLTEWAEREEQTLRKLFNENQFFNAKRSGFSLTEQRYALSLDTQKAQEFINQLRALESYQQIQESCDITEGFSDENWPTMTMDIWVNPWTHDLKRINATIDDENYSSTIDMYLDLGKEVNIKAPSDAKTFKEVMEDFQQDQEQMPDESELMLQQGATPIGI